MAKIIIKDMKFNKDKKPTILKKNDDLFSQTSENYYSNQRESKKAREQGTEKPAYHESPKTFYQYSSTNDELKENEEKIDEYMKSRLRSEPRLQRTPQIRKKRKLLHKPVFLIFLLCIIGGGIYWGGNIFQKANVTITPKHQVVSYNGKQFNASKDNTDSNSIDFEIMIMSDKKSKGIILTESKDVSIKAKGSITLYNEFSITPVKLPAGSFIDDENGKTYKTDTTIDIPGYKLDAAKKLIPGQVDADITSFLAGDSYNGSPTDFYINSFKGSTKYNKIYGKLKSPFVGGAVGMFFTLDDVSKSNIDENVINSLKNDLLNQVKALVPPGYILYPDATAFSYNIAGDVLSKTPNANIEIEGSLSVVLLHENSLTKNIIKISLPDISQDELKEISLPDLSKLTFSFADKDQQITKDMSSVSFSLSGGVNAIWNPDVENIKTKLLGVNKNEVLPIFKQDKGISSAVVKIFPPWQKYIPKDSSKINVIIK